MAGKWLRRVGIGAPAFCAVGLLIWLAASRHAPQKRPYRIGWEIDPPEQSRGDHGEPTGFAVDLVKEAARRRGIRIEWVYRPESSEAALRGGQVDLWPVMTITSEPAAVVHIPPPFLESTFCLLVRSGSSARRLGDLSPTKA